MACRFDALKDPIATLEQLGRSKPHLLTAGPLGGGQSPLPC
jgi:hypothetical protein